MFSKIWRLFPYSDSREFFALEQGKFLSLQGIQGISFASWAFTGWTVVDFKTDREFATSSDRYTAQLRVYSEAIRTATSSPTRGILLVL